MVYYNFMLFWCVSFCAGIGVPILLSYVYCVVPISLCRSGGCGVSTTNSEGVRIDFDESDVPAGTGPGAFVGEAYVKVRLDCANLLNSIFLFTTKDLKAIIIDWMLFKVLGSKGNWCFCYMIFVIHWSKNLL